jgi:hypothetical protein
VLAAAAWGMWALRSRRWELLALYLLPAAAGLTAIVAYGEPLARAAIDPALALLAAAPVLRRRDRAATAGETGGRRPRRRRKGAGS